MYSSKISEKIKSVFNNHVFNHAKGISWLSIEKTILLFVTGIISILMANVLEEQDYGMYKYYINIISITMCFAYSGIQQEITIQVARGNKNILHEASRKTATWNLFSLLLLSVISSYYYIHENSTLGTAVLLVGFIQYLSKIFGLHIYLPLGSGNFKLSTIRNSMAAFIKVLLILGTIIYSKNIILLGFIYYGSEMAVNFYYWINLIKIRKNYKRANKKIDNVFATKLSIISTINSLLSQLDQFIVFQIFGPIPLAGYSIAILIPNQIQSYFRSIGTMALTKISKRSSIEVNNIHKKTFLLGIIITLIAFVYILTIPILIKILFPKYISIIKIAQHAMLPVIFSTTLTLYSKFLESKKQIDKIVKINIISSTYSLVFMIIGSYLFGMLGLIYSRVLTKLLNLIQLYLNVKKVD